jgi:hypothetical protein
MWTAAKSGILKKQGPALTLMQTIIDQFCIWVAHNSFPKGLGAECASIGEIFNCLHAGFTCDKIVYDSPVKTAAEISKYMSSKPA